jgi:VanZ family protein
VNKECYFILGQQFMFFLSQSWYRCISMQWGARITLSILFPLSLWLALIPVDQYVPSAIFSDKILHFVVFFGFAVLLDMARPTKQFWLQYGLPLIVYGAVIEVLQSFSIYRSFSVWDGVADAAGVVVFWLILIRYKKQATVKA